MTQTHNHSPNRIAFLDGLKGFAILAVMVCHAAGVITEQGLPFTFPSLASFFPTGGLGVHLFFMVSAFTLALSVQNRLGEKGLWGRFYLRRAVRILPLWWMVVLLQSAIQHSDWGRTFLNLTFGFGFVRYDPSLELIPYGWSLFVEEIFYLGFPLLLALSKDIKGTVQFFIGAIVVNQIWNFTGAKLGVPSSNYYIEFHPLHHGYNFALGLLLFHLHQNTAAKENFLESPQWTSTLNWAPLLLGVAFARQIAPFHSLTMLGVFVATLSTRTWFHRLLTRPLFTRWGVSCYSIYLWHWFLAEGMKHYFKHHPLSGSAEGHLVWFVPAFIAIMTVVGSLSFRFLERPLGRLGRRLLLPKLSESTDRYERGIGRINASLSFDDSHLVDSQRHRRERQQEVA